MIPPAGAARRDALQRIALANGTVDKIGGGELRAADPPFALSLAGMDRALTPRGAARSKRWTRLDWPARRDRSGADHRRLHDRLYPRHRTGPDAAGRYPSLDALAVRLGARPEFRDTASADYAVPRGE